MVLLLVSTSGVVLWNTLGAPSLGEKLCKNTYTAHIYSIYRTWFQFNVVTLWFFSLQSLFPSYDNYSRWHRFPEMSNPCHAMYKLIRLWVLGVDCTSRYHAFVHSHIECVYSQHTLDFWRHRYHPRPVRHATFIFCLQHARVAGVRTFGR